MRLHLSTSMVLALPLALVACATGDAVGTCEDGDGDGLDDCVEADELGTDPTLPDSDGDGATDGEELDCDADPLDATSTCYACNWPQRDPGDLATTGDAEGDVVAALTFKDQCREDVALYDFAGTYQILFMTAVWCQPCIAEAKELEKRTRQFTRRTGLPFHYSVVLFEDAQSQPPRARDAVGYAETITASTMPVFASTDVGILEHTPYDGKSLPGKCIVTPDMELLHCTTGHGDDQDLFDRIEAHAAGE